MELSADDGGLENMPGSSDWQHHRAEAIRANTADHAQTGRVHRQYIPAWCHQHRLWSRGICGWGIKVAPADSPRPQALLVTPGGDILAMNSASLSVVSGVCSDGFSTMVLPVATAGHIFQAAIISG